MRLATFSIYKLIPIIQQALRLYPFSDSLIFSYFFSYFVEICTRMELTIFDKTTFLVFKQLESYKNVSAPYSLKNLYRSSSRAYLIEATTLLMVSGLIPSFFTQKQVDKTLICLKRVLWCSIKVSIIFISVCISYFIGSECWSVVSYSHRNVCTAAIYFAVFRSVGIFSIFLVIYSEPYLISLIVFYE